MCKAQKTVREVFFHPLLCPGAHFLLIFREVSNLIFNFQLSKSGSGGRKKGRWKARRERKRRRRWKEEISRYDFLVFICETLMETTHLSPLLFSLSLYCIMLRRVARWAT